MCALCLSRDLTKFSKTRSRIHLFESPKRVDRRLLGDYEVYDMMKRHIDIFLYLPAAAIIIHNARKLCKNHLQSRTQTTRSTVAFSAHYEFMILSVLSNGRKF